MELSTGDLFKNVNITTDSNNLQKYIDTFLDAN